MIFAQISNKKIVNTIELEDDSLLNLFKIDPSTGMDFDCVLQIDTIDPLPGIGWSYDKGIFIAPPIPGTIPDVTPRQMRQALILYGVYDLIEPALDQLPEPMKSLAKVEWEYSLAFQRTRPIVQQVGQLLGWNDDQLDALWIFAGTL